jgi:cell wall-associated NlpC family hydrolase
MKFAWMLAASLLIAASGCRTLSIAPNTPMQTSDPSQIVSNAVQSVRTKFAPDPHLAIFIVNIAREGKKIVLKGEVENEEAKKGVLEAVAHTGIAAEDRILILPAPELGDRTWGIATVSLVNVREKPGNASEMGTQILMGNVFRVWEQTTNWYLVQTADRYPGWAEGGGFITCTREQADAWNASPLLIVTAFDDRVLEEPEPDALPVSDVTMGNLVKYTGQVGIWLKVQLPDGRAGFLPRKSAMDYGDWRASRSPTAENIERAAKSFLGRPYFWGCNSIRGMDCSGFTKFTFFLNGVDLHRNASQQMADGTEVSLDDDFTNLKKGDLLFFGRRATTKSPERITHVGIYLGDKLFIHSAGMVHVSSLDPDSPLHDSRRIRSLLHACRVLKE